jgi:hypothetical protein
VELPERAVLPYDSGVQRADRAPCSIFASHGFDSPGGPARSWTREIPGKVKEA